MNARRPRGITVAAPPVRVPDRAAMQLIDLLTYSGWPVTIDELRREGIPAPAQAIYELQLAGYEIDRVPIGQAGENHGCGYRLRTEASSAVDSREPAGRRSEAPSRRRRALVPGH